MSEFAHGLWRPRELGKVEVNLTSGEKEIVEIVKKTLTSRKGLKFLIKQLESLGDDDTGYYSVENDPEINRTLGEIVDQLSAPPIELNNLPIIIRPMVEQILRFDVNYKSSLLRNEGGQTAVYRRDEIQPAA